MSSINDLVLERSEDMPESMKIVSDVLEPITISAKQARFVLPRAGILSKESVFQFELTTPLGSGFLPAGAGIYSLFDSCSLFVGQQRIQHTNQLGIYKTITKSYDTPSYRQNYTRLMNGINTILTPAPVGVDPTSIAKNENAGKVCMPGVSLDSNTPQNITLPYDLNITNDPNTTPSWSVKIKELFPLCDKINLPLYLLKEPVSIVFNFNTQQGTDSVSKNSIGSLCCFDFTGNNTGRAPGVNLACSLNKESCQFFPDYLYYTEERQFAIQEEMNANKGMAKIYTDVVSVNSSLPRAAVPPANDDAIVDIPFTFQIPLSNYSAKNLLLAFTPSTYENTTGTNYIGTNILNYNAIFGKYAMLNSVKPYTIQVRLNDKLEFPQPLISNTLKAQEAEYVYGSPVNLHTGLYSNNGCNKGENNFETLNAASYYPISSDTANKKFEYFGGMNLNHNLTGMQHFFALNVSHLYGDSDMDSVRISQKPIEIFGTYPVSKISDFTGGYNVACFSEITKMFAVKDGLVQIYDYAETRMGQ